MQGQEATADCGGASNPLHGRTLKVVETIVSDLSAGNCDSVTNTQLAGITNLIMSHKVLTSLQDGDFAGLTGMTALDLNNNSLTTLPEDVFDGLSSLQTLDLNNNSLTTLPEDVFDGLSSLQTLNLFFNSLTTLPEDVFDGLSSLQTLNLDHNSLTTLPEDLFDGLSSLQDLRLDHNSLTTLPADVFDGLSSLQDLWLDRNSLTALPGDVFDGLSSLQDLDLYSNSLTALPGDVFDGLSSLQDLDLYSNSLTALPGDVFDGLSSLQDLRLDQNSLEWLAPGLFGGLSGLEELYLNQNSSLACIHAGQFDGLSNLQILYLQSTKLGNIAPAHGSRWGLNSLEELRFGSTAIGDSALSFQDYQTVFPALFDTRTYVNLAALSDPICGSITADADGSYDGTVRVKLDHASVYPNRAQESGRNGDGHCGADPSEDGRKLWTWQRSQDGLTWANVAPGRQPPDYGSEGRMNGECSFIYTPHRDDNGMYVRAFVPVDTVGVSDENDYHSAAYGPLNLRP